VVNIGGLSTERSQNNMVGKGEVKTTIVHDFMKNCSRELGEEGSPFK